MNVFKFIILWVSFYNPFIQGLLNLPPALEIVDEIVIVLYLIYLMLKKKNLYFKGAFVNYYLVLVLMFYLYNIFIVQQDLIKILYGSRFLAIPLILEIIIINMDTNYEELSKLFKFILNIILVHTIILFLQGCYYFIIDHTLGDHVTGIVGGYSANVLGFLIAFQAIYYFLKYINGTNKLKSIFMICLSTIVILFCEAKAAFLCLILSAIVCFFKLKKDSMKNALLAIGIFAIVILISTQLLETIPQLSYLKNFNVIAAVEHEMVDYPKIGAAARITHFQYANNILNQFAPNTLLGVGFSTYESSGGNYFKAPLAVMKMAFFTLITGKEVVTHSQITTIMVEMGYLGLIMLQLGFLICYFRLKYLQGNKIIHDQIHFIKLATIIVFLAQLSCNILEYQYFACVYYILLFCTAAQSRICDNDKLDKIYVPNMKVEVNSA